MYKVKMTNKYDLKKRGRSSGTTVHPLVDNTAPV